MMRHRDLKGLFGNQALTIGFALAVGIDLLNGLSVLSSATANSCLRI